MKKILLILILGLIILIGYNYIVKLSKNKTLSVSSKKMITVSSNAFNYGEIIPKRYTCDGENVNPPLTISGVSEKTKSLVLIIDDPDAPAGTWTHWLVWNIDPKTKEIKENSVPSGAVLGKNDFGYTQYGGPCPPGGTHRYFFRLYALDTVLNLLKGASRQDLESAMKNHIIDQGELMGKYSR